MLGETTTITWNSHYPDGVSEAGATPPTSTSMSASGPEDPRGDLRWGSIPALVRDAADRFGDKEALVFGEVRLSFSDLAERALEVTRAAMAIGIGIGDRVAIWAPNSDAWVVAALGVVGSGAVLVPINTRFKGGEAAHVLRSSGARVLLTVESFLGNHYPSMLADEDVPDLERMVLLHEPAGPGPEVPQKPPPQKPPESGELYEVTRSDEVPVYGWSEFLAAEDGVVEGDSAVSGRKVEVSSAEDRWFSVKTTDLSDLMFTSGTTGSPKGAMTTHAQSLRAFATWASIVGLHESDRYLVVNPFFHTFGYKAGLLACLMEGATLVPVDVFDVDKVLELIGSEHISVVPGPPTLYQSILDHPRSGAMTSRRSASP